MSESSYSWGTVTALAPLRVQLDGDTAALPFTPDSLVDPARLAVSDRVRCELATNRLIVHGSSGGLELLRAIAAGRGLKNHIINGRGRINQRNYVSGTAVPGGTYMLDRWRAQTELITNIATNPVFGAALTGLALRNAGTGATHAVSWQSGAGHNGAGFGRISVTTGSANFWSHWVQPVSTALVAGASETAAVWVKSTVADTIRTRLYTYTDAAGTTGESFIDGADVVLVANTWTRLPVASGALAAGVASTRVAIRGATSTTGSTIDVDDVTAVSGLVDRGDFSGATASTSSYAYAWTGTANASTSTRNALTSITYASTPQGSTFTIAGLGIEQVIERANMVATTYVHSWGASGTALGRVFNSGATAPSYVAPGATYVIDGLADVVVQFNAGTMSNAQLEIATVSTAFEYLPYSLELLLCQRYYLRWQPTAVNQRIAGLGFLISTTQSELIITTPVTMRAQPTITFSALWTTDGVTANGAVSTIAHYFNITPPVSPNNLSLIITHAAYGAARTPAVLSAQNGTTSFLALDAEL